MANIEFYDRTMEEALALLTESQRYLNDKTASRGIPLDIQQGLISSVETMRLVARLTQVLAWVLTQRAVMNDEISPQEALDPNRRLGGQELCLHDSSAEVTGLPSEFQGLLSRSLGLYRRAARLDELAGIRASELTETKDAAWPFSLKSVKPDA